MRLWWINWQMQRWKTMRSVSRDEVEQAQFWIDHYHDERIDELDRLGRLNES